MTLLKKFLGVLLFIGVTVPVSISLLMRTFDGNVSVGQLLAIGAVALSLTVISHRLWAVDSGSFQRKIAKIRQQWGDDGDWDVPLELEIPADLETAVTLMKYRRTGSFAIPMFRQRVRLWKGANISLNAGRISAPKGWVKEESGTLRLTGKHLIYVGQRSNKKMTWKSIVALVADHGVLEVQQANRGAIRWQGKGINPEFVAAAELLWQAAETGGATIAVRA